ncbi:MAG TPA: MaoC family dehydratase [Candidatus Binataceae bacterium]|nr:MaoC family dehydratase [Candidatus Binataceae bacterium]
MKSDAPIVSGPYFEDLEIGPFPGSAPAQTLTDGLAALHRSIVGGRLRLALDAELSRRVTGGVLASPGLVWDIAIGQSTLVTHRVVANLFYKQFMFLRLPCIGDTLYTTTEIVALRQNRVREGRAATGLAALRMRTRDQAGRPVLDFYRCAMIPLRDPKGSTGRNDDLESIPSDLDPQAMRRPTSQWHLADFRAAVPGQHFEGLVPGTLCEIAGGDLVSSAPELARLTLNIAMVHHDVRAGAGGRLVYGGHTIGIAATQATRALPNLATIVAWHSCDHLAPVREGDTLRSTLEIEACEPLPGGGGLVHLRSRVRADRDGDAQDVLDWRFVGVMA